MFSGKKVILIVTDKAFMKHSTAELFSEMVAIMPHQFLLGYLMQVKHFLQVRLQFKVTNDLLILAAY